ncbi:DUF6415 family natural product biosynthesis protein [Streptomyces sp. NPDC045470]|uniref:DUF6415 family natural product biosynthesis protein n=1 Tax=Streptomyces sp. NPDC045470 TaxID=3155469 RepID=UPI0033DE3DC6
MQTVKIPSPGSRTATDAAAPGTGRITEETCQQMLARAWTMISESSGAPEEWIAVQAALCGHIAVLAPRVRVRTEQLWHGSVQWDRLTARLDDITYLTRRPLRDPWLVTLAHLADLAHACRWLLVQAAPRTEKLPPTQGGRSAS